MAAAKRGRVCVLDGVHRLHPDTLASLARLLQDRAVELYDGTRLVRGGGGVEGGEDGLGVLPIHPAFRVVALGETAATGGAAGGQRAAAAAAWGGGMQVRVCCVLGCMIIVRAGDYARTNHNDASHVPYDYCNDRTHDSRHHRDQKWAQQQDVAPLFSWIQLPSLSAEEHRHVLTQGFPLLAPRVRETCVLQTLGCFWVAALNEP